MVNRGVQSFTHFRTWMAQPLKFGNGLSNLIPDFIVINFNPNMEK